MDEGDDPETILKMVKDTLSGSWDVDFSFTATTLTLDFVNFFAKGDAVLWQNRYSAQRPEGQNSFLAGAGTVAKQRFGCFENTPGIFTQK